MRADYNWFSPGKVLRKNPKTPNFSPRVADEMFKAFKEATGSQDPVRVYDCFLGNGVGLSVVQGLHAESISYLYGSDINPMAVDIARANLEMVSNPAALATRARQLASFYRSRSEFRRDSRRGPETLEQYAEMAKAMGKHIHVDGFSPAPYHVFHANAFDVDLIRKQTGGGIDLLFTDPPYSEQSQLSDEHGRDVGCQTVSRILSGMRGVLSGRGTLCVMFRRGVTLDFDGFETIRTKYFSDRTGYLLAPK